MTHSGCLRVTGGVEYNTSMSRVKGLEHTDRSFFSSMGVHGVALKQRINKMDKRLLEIRDLIKASGLAQSNKVAAQLLAEINKVAGHQKSAMLPTNWGSKKTSEGTLTLNDTRAYFVQMWWGAMTKLGQTTLDMPEALKDITAIERYFGSKIGAPINPRVEAKLPAPRLELLKSINDAWAKHSKTYETAWNRIWWRAYNATTYKTTTKKYRTTEDKTQAEQEQALAVFDKYFKGGALYTFCANSLTLLSNLESVFEQASALICGNIENGNFSRNVSTVDLDSGDFGGGDGGGGDYNLTYEDMALEYKAAPLRVVEHLLEDDEHWGELVDEAAKKDPNFMISLGRVIDEMGADRAFQADLVGSTKINSLPQMEMLAILLDDCLSAKSRSKIKASTPSALSNGVYAILYAFFAWEGFKFTKRDGSTDTIKLTGNPFLPNWRSFVAGAEGLRLAEDFDGVVIKLWKQVEKYIPKKTFTVTFETFKEKMNQLVWGGVRPGVASAEGGIKASRLILVACLAEFIHLRLVLEVSSDAVLELVEPGIDSVDCVEALKAITMAPSRLIEEAKTELIEKLFFKSPKTIFQKTPR